MVKAISEFQKNKQWVRRPTGTSFARAFGFNKENVDDFFRLLEKLYEKIKYPPNRIYNVDESGLTVVQSKISEVIGNRGKRQITSLTSNRNWHCFYTSPKSQKTIFQLSTCDEEGTIDEFTKKATMVEFYNQTKGGVDTLDEMCSLASCSQKTRRYPTTLCNFHGMLNIAFINSYVIRVNITLNANKKLLSRHEYLKTALKKSGAKNAK